MILDAHHHLWRYDGDEYGWISEGMEVIARDFGVEDLRAVAEPAGVAGSIVVQARQTIAETQWLLEVAAKSDFIRGVVGWAPLVRSGIGALLDGWRDQPKLVGVRHVVQDEPDDAFLERDDFNRGVAEAHHRGLTYDLLIFARHLPQAIRFVDRHPQGRIVLDHIAKPAVGKGEIDPWRTQLAQLAQRPHISCKLSGVVTEANWRDWSAESIRPYLDAALEAFGPRRLMFGSDWPVCLLAASYERWLEVVAEWAAPLSADERSSIFHGAAAQAYRLEDCQR